MEMDLAMDLTPDIRAALNRKFANPAFCDENPEVVDAYLFRFSIEDQNQTIKARIRREVDRIIQEM